MREGFPFYENPEERIARAHSFDELKFILYSLKRVIGSQKVYSGEELVTIIDQVRTGERELEEVTQSLGLRRVVDRLMIAEIENTKVDFDKIGGISQ